MSIIPRLKNSLCGCSLETGSMIIAWLAVILVSFEIVLGACFYGVLIQYIEQKLQENHQENNEGTLIQVKLVAAMVFVILSFVMVVDTMLLVGVYKRNHCLMTPYLIFGCIGCGFSLLSLVINVIATLFNLQLFMSTVVQCGVTTVVVYCFLIVYSFYHEVKEEKLINDNRFKQLG